MILGDQVDSLYFGRTIALLPLNHLGPEDMHIDVFRMFLPTSVVLVLSLIVAGCGEEEQAKAAAQWLETYSEQNPPNKEWISTNIAVDDKGRVVMEVLVPDQGQVDLIKSRNRIEQTHIVRMACPPKDAEVWEILSSAQVLWINLLEKTSSGLFKPITGSSCKH
tara:strand:+ start:63 stop:554 length:492 start_codon:yes stop_codon:yes gene_type:complete